MHHNETRQGLALFCGVRLMDRGNLLWMERAACKGTSVEMFPEPPNKSNAERARYAIQVAAAKAVCEGCPVQEECLNDALDREEHWGIWGGQDLYVPWRELRHPERNAS